MGRNYFGRGIYPPRNSKWWRGKWRRGKKPRENVSKVGESEGCAATMEREREQEREKQSALTTTLLYILAFITTTILTGSLTIAGVVVGPACAAANFAANFAITSANSVITVPTALFLIEKLAPSLCQAAKEARPTMLRVLCFAYLDLELRLREILLPVFIITDLFLRCLYLGMVLLTNPGCAWALARRTARCTCYAAAFGLWSFPYWAWSASDVLGLSLIHI